MVVTQQAVRTKAAAGHLDKEDLPVMIESGISRLDMSKLGQPLSNKVLALEKKLQLELKHVAESEVGAGKVLSQIQDLLAPLKLFVLYLNRQPWMSVATAYRYIRIYKRVEDDPKLSPAVVQMAAAQNVPIFADSEKRPYGKLTEAVNAMPKAPNDQEGAAKWLFALRVKARDLQKPRAVMSPLDRLAEGIVAAYKKQLGKENMLEWKDFWAELARRTDVLLKRAEREREAA